MKWSKLKQTVESGFATSVQHRVELFSTRYHRPNSLSGRAWITIDGVQIVNMSTMKSGSVYRCIYHEATPTNCVTHPSVKDEERTSGLLIEPGEFSRFDLHACAFEFTQTPIEEALAHDSPLVNLLAVLDRRVGKRRLPELGKRYTHPLEVRLYKFRMEAEQLKIIE
jgi:hypothetical protein